MMTKLLLLLAVSGFFATPVFLPSASGIEAGQPIPGYGPVPADCSALLPSCSQCHAGSAPSQTAPNASTPTTTITTDGDVRAIPAGGTIDVTTTITGGLGSQGGFVCETTAGTFTASASTPGATRIVTNPASITHLGNNDTTWTYPLDAPTTPGLIEVTSAGLSANGDFTVTGDAFSFAGFDRNAQQATPVRLFALPTGIANLGTACPDGYGNRAVLGADSAPTAGNTGFELQLHGAAPNAWAILWGSFNTTPNFATPLDGIGLTGCTMYLESLTASQAMITTTGSAERADGAASFPLPIAGSGAMIGARFQVQAGYLDASVVAPTNVGPLVRSLPLSLTNGLEVTVQ